ncbi:MAG: 3-methyl-2-oxobutanoate dehydrogenase subunit VorB [Kiritimatiellae bacterium]|nr:3-methyl-2-oxobutanoate dehydrogenase subunit VorB [Kiritimatiellia bacterium]
MVRFVKGNEAVVIGALYAGCDCYFGYPITPASEIAHAASDHFPAVGRVFLQAECETAAINMVYGAASSGLRAITGSSGLGVSLMQETLSYMAAAELPGVVVNIQRAGPGLGNIYAEQADYNQAVKGGGHGSYHSIVLAPGNVQEMCDFTIRAFDLSFKYRNPVIVLADGVLGQMMETLRLPATERPRTDTSTWAVEGNAATRRNLITSIFLEATVLEALNLKLQAKYARLQAEAEAECYRTEDAEIVLAAYGISSRLARTAVDTLRQQGLRAGLFRPITLYPFPVRQLAEAVRGRHLAVVELSCGQFRDDIVFQLAAAGEAQPPIALINRMGGILLTVDEIVEGARAALSGRKGRGA